MADKKRFKKIYSQGALQGMEIWVDTETGAHYVCSFNGQAGGITPLLGPDGKPVIDKNYDE